MGSSGSALARWSVKLRAGSFTPIGPHCPPNPVLRCGAMGALVARWQAPGVGGIGEGRLAARQRRGPAMHHEGQTLTQHRPPRPDLIPPGSGTGAPCHTHDVGATAPTVGVQRGVTSSMGMNVIGAVVVVIPVHCVSLLPSPMPDPPAALPISASIGPFFLIPAFAHVGHVVVPMSLIPNNTMAFPSQMHLAAS